MRDTEECVDNTTIEIYRDISVADKPLYELNALQKAWRTSQNL